MTRALGILTIAGALALSACGKQGDLERPGPLCCAQAKADYAAQQREAAEARARASQASKIEPLPADNAADNTVQP